MTRSRHEVRTRVAVVADQSLVTDSVLAALQEQGLDARPLEWPGEAVVPAPRQGPEAGFDVGLLLSDLDRPDRLRAAAWMIDVIHTRWLVLTGATRGPLWGAALASGARAVLSSSTPLQGVVRTLGEIGRGVDPVPAAERAELVDAWQERLREYVEARARVQTLTPREREVLLLLYEGESVRRIAALLETTPSTVRSHVKAVLRKLDVRSQLAAVAMVGHLVQLEGLEPSPPDPEVLAP